MQTREHPEHPVPVLRVDADTVVIDMQLHEPTFGPGTDLDSWGLLEAAELQSVADQVLQHRRHRGIVTPHRRKLAHLHSAHLAPGCDPAGKADGVYFGPQLLGVQEP